MSYIHDNNTITKKDHEKIFWLSGTFHQQRASQRKTRTKKLYKRPVKATPCYESENQQRYSARDFFFHRYAPEITQA